MANTHLTKIVHYRDLTALGFPGYRVGDDGSVWTCRKRVWIGYRRGLTTVIGDTWKPLKLSANWSGHLRVELSGRRKRFVHRLVLEAFVGPCPVGMQCCHFPDRNPANNSLSNLRWDTAVANCRDAVIHQPLSRRGDNHVNASLTSGIVAAIRRRYESGEKQAHIASSLGLDRSQVWRIVRRKTWRHIP